MNTEDRAHELFAILAADTALFTLKNGKLHVRLIAINRPPHFPNGKGLPGGLLKPSETAEDAARRHTETRGSVSLAHVNFEQLYTFSEVDRDPRGRVVAVAYLALVPWEQLGEKGQKDSPIAFWCPIETAKKLSYDHDIVLKTALSRLRSRIAYTTLISKIMPPAFTLTELEQTYEHILDRKLDKRNFRKKILKMEIVKALPIKRTGGKFRPAQLYKFSTNKVIEINII